MRRIKSVIGLAAAYFAACFAAASAGYGIFAVLSYMLFGRVVVFGAAPRMFLYHWEHPFQYIAVAAASYAVVGTCWSVFRDGTVVGWRRCVQIWLVIFASLALATPFGSALYSYHDMLAGFIPYNWRAKLAKDIMLGLANTPLIMLLSAPYSVLGLVAGYYITRAIDGRCRRGGLGFVV